MSLTKEFTTAVKAAARLIRGLAMRNGHYNGCDTHMRPTATSSTLSLNAKSANWSQELLKLCWTSSA